jgi:2'-5' RNA ligase
MQPYTAKWQQFSRLRSTHDSLAAERRGLRHRLPKAYIAFVIPIDDPVVLGQLALWQEAFRAQLAYAPLPVTNFHITLHYVGRLNETFWLGLLPNTWRRKTLDGLAQKAGRALAGTKPFEITIGPLNAFPNVLIAEVQDAQQECLRRLHATLRRALPIRARPRMAWAYLPHVTLGYWGEQAAAPLVEQLRSFRAVQPVTFTVERVRFTVYRLDGSLPVEGALLTAQEDIIAEFTLQD